MVDALYDRIGGGYATHRSSDPRIAAAIQDALGSADTVVDVGSGAGSYEPAGCRVVAVEPAAVMIAQRPPTAAPVVRAVAERLPFRDKTFDAAMAILTVHHWSDPRAGLGELARVSSRQVVFTWEPRVTARFWLVAEYLPSLAERERHLATLQEVTDGLGVVEVRPVAVPADCADGFLGAFWRRPEAYLSPEVRSSISAFDRCDPLEVQTAMSRLRADVASGRWERDHHELLATEEHDLGYRLVVAETV